METAAVFKQIFDENIENGSILKLFCFVEKYSFGKTGRNSKLSK